MISNPGGAKSYSIVLGYSTQFDALGKLLDVFVNGEVTIPGNLLRREVFDPVVNQVRLATSLVAGLMPASPSPCPFRPWRTLAYGTALPLPSIGVRANRSSDKEGRSTARRPPPRGRFLR